jgi:hypothetical protein
MRKVALIGILALSLFSCTENSRAKQWGGTEELTLKKNEVLINMTWKESNLWVQTLDTTTGIQYFREKSSWGWLEGEIIIKPIDNSINIEGVQFKR